MNQIPYKNNFYERYNNNVYSQNGEDGVIEELLKRLKISQGYVCEYGAWDGKHLSNTFNLVTKGFKAVYIESDPERYKDLLKTKESYPQIIPINAYVDSKPTENSLDNLLNTTDIPIDYEVLSIDIDSFDYHTWKYSVNYRPKIVIIEINSGINPLIPDHIHCPNVYQGTSFNPMLSLGKEKGYTFVLHTGNMFFVRNDLFSKLNLSYNNPLENFRRKWIN